MKHGSFKMGFLIYMVVFVLGGRIAEDKKGVDRSSTVIAKDPEGRKFACLSFTCPKNATKLFCRKKEKSFDVFSFEKAREKN